METEVLTAMLIIVATIICFIIFRRIISAIKPELNMDELISKIESYEGNMGNDIVCVLEKHHWQRLGKTPITPIPDNASEEKKKKLREYHEWTIDGKPTGIESDEIFFSLQRHIFGDIIWK